MNRCTDYFESFYYISTRCSHIYMKNSAFVSSGNDYLPLHCLQLVCCQSHVIYLPGYQNEHIGCSESILVHKGFN